jgi:NADPH:quinone reductase-like Zn-dependent oxidoreductase
VCSTAKVDLVRSLGADHVIDYTRQDFAYGEHQYDAILDCGGNTKLSRLRRALTPRGTLVIVGGEGGDPVTGMGRQLHARILSPFVRQRLTFIVNRERQADLERLRTLVNDGIVKPAVDTVYPLEQAAEAVRHLVAGRTQGKLAVAVNEPATP